MQKMCHPIAVALFDSTYEPMTTFDDHEKALLESALNNPRQTFNGNDLYPLLTEKAAILYYGLIKNHPFKNGNKRTATASLLVFLFINGFWVYDGNTQVEDYLVELAKRVAKSEGSGDKEKFLVEIKEWISGHIMRLPLQDSA